jgi:hypothetical protein
MIGFDHVEVDKRGGVHRASLSVTGLELGILGGLGLVAAWSFGLISGKGPDSDVEAHCRDASCAECVEACARYKAAKASLDLAERALTNPIVILGKLAGLDPLGLSQAAIDAARAAVESARATVLSCTCEGNGNGMTTTPADVLTGGGPGSQFGLQLGEVTCALSRREAAELRAACLGAGGSWTWIGSDFLCGRCDRGSSVALSQSIASVGSPASSSAGGPSSATGGGTGGSKPGVFPI